MSMKLDAGTLRVLEAMSGLDRTPTKKLPKRGWKVRRKKANKVARASRRANR